MKKLFMPKRMLRNLKTQTFLIWLKNDTVFHFHFNITCCLLFPYQHHPTYDSFILSWFLWLLHVIHLNLMILELETTYEKKFRVLVFLGYLTQITFIGHSFIWKFYDPIIHYSWVIFCCIFIPFSLSMSGTDNIANFLVLVRSGS